MGGVIILNQSCSSQRIMYPRFIGPGSLTTWFGWLAGAIFILPLQVLYILHLTLIRLSIGPNLLVVSLAFRFLVPYLLCVLLGSSVCKMIVLPRL